MGRGEEGGEEGERCGEALTVHASGGEVGEGRGVRDGEVEAGLDDGEVGAGRVDIGAGCGEAGARAMTETMDGGARQPGGVDVVGVVGAELQDEK